MLQPQLPQQQRAYFEPGWAVFLVEHDDPQPGQVIDGLAQTPQLTGWLQDFAVGNIANDQILTFPRISSATLEEVQLADLPAPWRPASDKPAFSLAFLPHVDPNIGEPALMGVIEGLNQSIPLDGIGLPLGNGLFLRAVSPNWLTTPTPEVGGGGGPGSEPTPVPDTIFDPEHLRLNIGQDDISATRYGFIFESLPLPYTAGDPVEVVILDTAPADAEFREAAKRWGPEHPVLRSLMQQFTITDPGFRLPVPGRFELAGHNYRMSDHGLFVAGIIRTIVPNAKLHLIKVLNDYGVGYLMSIAAVLCDLAIKRTCSTTPLIINCSLMMNMPAAYEDDLDKVARLVTDDRTQIGDLARLSNDQREIFVQLYALRLAFYWVCLSMRQQNVMIVAAAGNNARSRRGESDEARPQARCPAAFATVRGVAAIDKHGRSASYSNIADRQAGEGIATFGGERPVGKITSAILRWTDQKVWKDLATSDEAPGNTAVLGAYINNFDTSQGNANGWAWWAGTSFATAIISGALAQLVSTGLSPTLDRAYQKLISKDDGFTKENYDILMVRQGP